MAFGEVTPINYGQSVSYNDTLSLAAQTQDAMQQKYDVNTAKIEGMVEQISAIPIQQQAGKKYLMDKLQGVLNTVSANMKVSGGFGILSNSYTGGITSQIKGAIDDKVKKHIKYSADIINFEKGVAKLREKDPKLYNQANYDFAQYKSGLQNYLQGDENADLGSLQYVPYKDTNGDLLKKVKDLKDIKGNQIIETRNNKGELVKTTLNGMSVDEIVAYMPALLDAQDEQQLMIDGWYDLYTGKSDGKAEMSEFLKVKKENLKDEIDIESAKTSTNTSKDDLVIAKKRIESYNQQIQNLSEQETKVKDMPLEQIGYTLKKEQFKGTISKMLAGNTSVEVTVDPIYKMNREFENEDRKYALDVEKLKMEASKEGKKVDEDGNVVEDLKAGVAYEGISDQDLESMPGKDRYNAVKGRFNELYDDVVSTGTAIVNDAPKEEKIAIIAKMKKLGITYNTNTNQFVNLKREHSVRDALTSVIGESALAEKEPTIYSQMLEKQQEGRKLSILIADAERKNVLDADSVKVKETGEIITVDQMVSRKQAAGINGTGETYIELGKSDTKAIDKEAAGKELISKDLNYIFQKNNIIMSSDKSARVLSMLDETDVAQYGFKRGKDSPPITIKQDKNKKTYIITQNVGADEDGKPKIARKEISMSDSSAGQYIKASIEDKENYHDLKDYKPGYIIAPTTKGKVLPVGSNIAIDTIENNIRTTVKSPTLSSKLVNFIEDERSLLLLQKAFIDNGYSEQDAEAKAQKVLGKVSSGLIEVNIQAGNLSWYNNLVVSGSEPIGYKLGNTTQADPSAIDAMKRYPAQYTLAFIYENLYRPEVIKLITK
jgi:hypothetical protein